MQAVTKDLDYLHVLEAINSLPFPLGRKSLIDVLHGASNEMTRRTKLEKEESFGILSGYSKEEIEEMLSRLAANGMVEKTGIASNTFLKVFTLTEKGKRELAQPTLHEKTVHATFDSTPITEGDKQLFTAFDFFLKNYNNEQKQAIISPANHILCVAGAGSGKTAVLTKRIEFLVRFRGVPKEKILAVTFTRKARQEMQERLNGMVQVETFNSFCERLLNRHGQLFYGKPVRVVRYADKMRMVHHALATFSLDSASIIASYFTQRQRNEQSKEKLFGMFVADCFSILDHYANIGKPLEDFSGKDPIAKRVYDICKHVKEEMHHEGLRDYSDQLLDTLTLFRGHPELIPEYDHILVDEYQDVNDIQKRLLDILAPNNLFVVGDPRQSIFGWRGSKVRFILEFAQEQPDAQTIVLHKNYRSTKGIVDVMNQTIKKMHLPDLTSANEVAGVIEIHEFGEDTNEIAFVTEKILHANVPKEEIFVLTRTNRQLQDIAAMFTARSIKHVVRSEEIARLTEAGEGEVTLSTVHAIKGLEASMVFVCGCNAQSFPCIASDRPIVDMVRKEEHDRDEEELRLLYVGLSRARKELYITYAGTPSKFLTPLQQYKKRGNKTLVVEKTNNTAFARLKEWRTNLSRKRAIPPYMILPDKTLIEIATMQPQTLDALADISGMGPMKLKQYGEAILDLVR